MDRFHLPGVYLAVAEGGSFAGAARKLGLSPPAVTRAINDLEGHLGLRLLTRTTRVVRVTEAGARYAEDARRTLAQLEEAAESARGLHGAPRGRLVVTAPAPFGALHVSPIVVDYLRRHPETTVQAMFLDRVVNLVDEDVDVAVRIGALPDSSLQAVRVGQVRRVICGAPAYLKRHGTPRSAAELQAHTLISAGSLTPTAEWRLREAGALRSVKLRPRLTTTSNETARSAAVQGLGLVRLLSYQVAGAIAARQLKPVLQVLEPEPLPVHVVDHEGRHATRKVRAFLDLAVATPRGNPALR